MADWQEENDHKHKTQRLSFKAVRKKRCHAVLLKLFYGIDVVFDFFFNAHMAICDCLVCVRGIYLATPKKDIVLSVALGSFLASLSLL